ncbi:hypothetical protein WJR50_18645 [Catalinimonas sp. 4WD22]|uniref:hypothetical protein n=1 Tax=Catalinimonas locisalis TaxID=3133978 RepID=UPI003100F37B
MSEIENTLRSKSRNELLVIAKRAKLKGYYTLNKKQLFKKIKSEADPTLLAQTLGLEKENIIKRILSSPYFQITAIIAFVFSVFVYFDTGDDSKKGDKIIYEFNGGSGEVFDFKYDGSTEILENRYPYGFKLIGVKYPDSIFQGPASANLESIYDVNWNTLKVKIDRKRDVVDIVLPVDNIQNGTGSIRNIDVEYSIPLKETYSPSPVPIKPNIKAQLYFQLLEESGPYPVYVFGFK